jgi:very-short-patch-repair endonuclease
MQTPTEVLARFGNIATRQQVIDAGLSGTDLTRAVRLGEIRRIRRAHYARVGATKEAAAAVRVGGKLAGVSAARSYGLWSGLDERVHVAVARNASRLRTSYGLGSSHDLTPDTSDHNIVIHWVDDYASQECWRASLPSTLRQVVAWSDRETAIACVDTAITKLGLDRASIIQIFADAPPADRLIASAARPGSDSGPESIARQRLENIEVRCIQQVFFAGVGHVDMLVRGTRVVIEIDGYEYHSSPAAYEEDRRRMAELVARGYIVVRLSYQRVMFDWPWCERMVLAALSQFRN